MYKRQILDRKLPWGLVLFGVMISVVLELAGIPSLAFAVGVYLPISTSCTMFMGGVVRWLVERKMSAAERASSSADSGPGVLFGSGLIAGGAIMGVVIAALQAKGADAAFDLSKYVGSFSTSIVVAMGIYVVALSIPLYRVGRRPA